MRKITEKAVFAEHNKTPRKVYFQDGEGGLKRIGLQTKAANPVFFTYVESAKKIFEYQTKLKLWPSIFKRGNYWRYVNGEEIDKIEDWMKKQGTLVYLRDCLSLSIALSINHTPTGLLRYKAKRLQDENSIHELVDMVEQRIRDLPYYQSADLICSVPPSSGKNFHLPDRIASLLDEKIDKQVVIECFVFDGIKLPIKDVPFSERWQNWEDARVSFQNGDEFNVNGKTVILIDDMYQSGITIQYIAMKLQQAGAREVYGLCLIKARRDTDNVSCNTDDG